MAIDWRSLSVGIELEFSFITRREAAAVLAEFFNNHYYHAGSEYDIYEIHDDKNRIWKVMRDGSIKGQRKLRGQVITADDGYLCEMVTPILFYDQDIEILQELIRRLRKMEANVNSSTGIHIHVGAKDFDAQHLRNIVNLVYSKQEILFRSLQVDENRKKYCQLFTSSFIEELNKVKPNTIEKFADIWYMYPVKSRGGGSRSRDARYNQSRYRLLNLSNLFSGRQLSLEYRCFNSIMHSGVIKSYILFCLMLTAKALNQNRASHKLMFTDNDKYSMRVWLVCGLGFVGPEYKNSRKHLLKLLTGDGAWRNGKNISCLEPNDNPF